MALDRFRAIVTKNEEAMVKAMFDDKRTYGFGRFGRTRCVLGSNGLVTDITDFHPYDEEYHMGEDAYKLVIQYMEAMCHLRVPDANTLSRRVQSKTMMSHIFQHVLDCDVFELLKKETNLVLPTTLLYSTGLEVFYTAERIAIYRSFLLGVVCYFMDKNIVQYLSDVVFDGFLEVFGNYVNWIPGRSGNFYFNLHNHVPFYGNILTNLSSLLCKMKAEDLNMRCSDDPCFISGHRPFFSIFQHNRQSTRATDM